MPILKKLLIMWNHVLMLLNLILILLKLILTLLIFLNLILMLLILTDTTNVPISAPYPETTNFPVPVSTSTEPSKYVKYTVLCMYLV